MSESVERRLAALNMQCAAADSRQEQPNLMKQECSVGDSSAYERRADSMDDVVIVDAIRTPITKAKRGGLKDTTADDLVGFVLKEIVARTGIDPKDVGDVVVGSVLGSNSQRANECRIGMFFAGFPDTVPVHTVNRQCSSGLQAVAEVAACIKAGFYSVGIAAGVETMTQNPMRWEGGVNPRIQQHQQAQSCLMPMGITSENVAAKFGVSRKQQDAFAAASHRKAVEAQRQGKFDAEIVPVTTHWEDPTTKERKQIVVDRDDGVRAETTEASLGRLPSVFKKGGSTTAGNSSQVSDGAAAVLLMSRREAQRRGMPILGVMLSFVAVGVDPAIMGVGPAVAIPAAVAQAGLTLDDIDVFEINEAFASQATYCIKHLGIDERKVNPNGGAIAFGHPLGCTGARQTATLLHEMKRRGRAARFGVVSMCIGSGMGAAAVFEQGGAVDALQNAQPVKTQTGLSRNAAV